MITTTLCFLLASSMAAADAPVPTPAEVETRWQALFSETKLDDTEHYCSPFLSDERPPVVVEAHKCLANVILARASVMSVSTAGIGPAYTKEGALAAVQHLDEALKLAPSDVTLHEGRLHILQLAGQYDAMTAALEDSIQRYKDPEGLEAWLNYCPELRDSRAYDAGLAFSKVLENHYPNDHRVVGNVGAFLILLERDDEAEKYLRKTVAMTPDDSIDVWNLGHLLDYTGRAKEADEYYRQAIRLASDPEQKRVDKCLYAHFVEKSLKDRERACKLEKESCPSDDRPACASKHK